MGERAQLPELRDRAQRCMRDGDRNAFFSWLAAATWDMADMPAAAAELLLLEAEWTSGHRSAAEIDAAIARVASPGRGLIVVVTGGRDYADRAHVFETLNAISLERCPLPPGCDWSTESGIAMLVHGGARGVDSLAAEWARNRRVEIQVFPADWDRYGKSAGHRRNGEMVTYLQRFEPRLVVAFPGGRGTADCVRQARAAHLPTRPCCSAHAGEERQR